MSYLPGDHPCQGGSRRHGSIARDAVPMLDHRVIEFAGRCHYDCVSGPGQEMAVEGTSESLRSADPD